MSFADIVLIVLAVAAVLVVAFYFLNRKATAKMAEQQVVIEKNKMVQSIFIIDKRKDKIDNVKMPKAVVDQLPKVVKMRKNYFVQAKVGPQITTLMCDKKVYEALPLKKNIKVELVGIYIMGIPGRDLSAPKKKGKKNESKAG